MRLLAIETSGTACSAAAWCGGRAPLRGHRRVEAGRGHAEALLPLVLGVLDDAGWGFADLDALAVNRGPGGFTGIRVGVAAARGLALAADLPVVGVGGLEVLAAAAAADGTRPAAILAALDARRGQVYAQTFAAVAGGVEPQGEPRATDPAAAAAAAVAAADGRPGPLVLVGSGAALVQPHVDAVADGRGVAVRGASLDAAAVAALAAAHLARRGASAAAPGFDLAPLYLRAPDARPQAPVVAAGAAAPAAGA